MEISKNIYNNDFKKKIEATIKLFLKEKKKLEINEILVYVGVDIESINDTDIYRKLVKQTFDLKNKILYKKIDKIIKSMTENGEKIKEEEVLSKVGIVSCLHNNETIPLYLHISNTIKSLKSKNKINNSKNVKSAKTNKKLKHTEDNVNVVDNVNKVELQNNVKLQDDVQIQNEVELQPVAQNDVIVEKEDDVEIYEDFISLEPDNSNLYTLTIKGMISLIKQERVILNLYSENNDVQRNEVWDNNKKSLLIDTIIGDEVDVPTLIFVKKDDKYMVADGKQRLITINSFINDGFKLSKNTKNFEQYEIANLKFSQLPTKLKNKILDSKISFQEIPYKSDIQIAELFIRLNSGEKLKPVEIWRASLGEKLPFVQKVAKHRCFKCFNFTKAQVNRFCDVEIALDLIMEELTPGSDHNKKTKETFVSSNSKYADFVDEFKNSIETKLDYIADALYDKDKEIVKTITSSANKIIVYRIIDLAINSGISSEEFYTFLEGYFTNKRNSYSRIAGHTSTSNKSSLNKRYKHIYDALKKYIKNQKQLSEDVNDNSETA